MNKLYPTLLLLACTGFAGSACADDNGWYAGLSLGQSNYAQMKPSTDATSVALAQQGLPNTATETATPFAYGLDVGYQFMPYLAVEGGYVDLGSASADFQIHLTPAGSAHVNIHATGEDLFAVGILPISDRFSLYGKLGLLAYSQKFDGSVTVGTTGSTIPGTSDTGTTTGIGVGASYRFNDTFGLRLGFTRFHSVGDANNTGEGTIDFSYLQFVAHF